MRPGGLWQHRDFLKLWTGQAISKIGSAISAQALPLTAVMVLGASPFQMGLLNGASGAAILLFGLFAGAWVDRFPRRPILIFADLMRAAVLATIPLAALFHRLSMGHLYVAAAATGVLTVLFDSGYQAYIPSLAERENMLEANAKLALTVSIADISGTGAAGVLVQWLTAPMAILWDAASFVCSAVSLWQIRKPEPAQKAGSQPHIGREIAEGLREAWRNPTLRILTKRTGVAAFFMGSFVCLYFVFAIRELHLKPGLLGLIIAVGGVSSLFGALVSERLVKRFGAGPALFGSAILCGIAGLLPCLARGPAPVCAGILALGQCFDMGWSIYGINEVTVRQTVTPEHLLGRVNSAMHLLFYGVMPVGGLVAGVAADYIGMRTTMLAGATGALVSSLWLAKIGQTLPRERSAQSAS